MFCHKNPTGPFQCFSASGNGFKLDFDGQSYRTNLSNLREWLFLFPPVHVWPVEQQLHNPPMMLTKECKWARMDRWTETEYKDASSVSSSCIAVALILSGLVRQQYSRVLPLHPIYFHHCVHDLSRKTACAANLGGWEVCGPVDYSTTSALELKDTLYKRITRFCINNEKHRFLLFLTVRISEQLSPWVFFYLVISYISFF